MTLKWTANSEQPTTKTWQIVFFGPVEWTGETGIAIHNEMSFELETGDTSLHVTARGSGDTVAFIDNVAALAIRENIATVDVQGSELLLPIND